MSWWRDRREALLFAASLAALGGGGAAWVLDRPAAADGCWVAGTVLGLAASGIWTAAAVRAREPTVDVIAVLALAGALIVGEPLAGSVVTAMLASGRLLEARAAARARRELRGLATRAPRTARRLDGGRATEVPAKDVAVGDRLLVGTGEVLPVDGWLGSAATLDESALTGEPMPVDREPGEAVRSGVVNTGGPLEMVATRTAGRSTYAAVVRLAEQAQASSAPFVRMADRIAVLFVPFTLALAGLAWAASGDPVRPVAVLVVATPCPLLLSAPIAVMSGMSRAARTGAIVKGGSVLERLARGRVLLFDKTGTLTRGQPRVVGITAGPGIEPEEVLRLAASLDQVSPHPLAASLVAAALERGLELQRPAGVREEHGHGLVGTVGDREVRLGKASWVSSAEHHPGWLRQARRRAALDASLNVFVGIDGQPAGAILLADEIRPDAPRMVRAIRDAGVDRVVLVTGDRADIAELVGRVVGVDQVLAECDPAEKVDAVREESRAAPSIMVGDGINDAPALAAAGVGVALASRGVSAATETADVVLIPDRIDALADAILAAQRARRIAFAAVAVGMGLSLVAMVVAALGYLHPAGGAVLQEGIDMLSIGIALLAVLPGSRHTVSMPDADVELARRLRTQHDAVLDVVEQCRSVADGLSEEHPRLAAAEELLQRIEDDLLPHEREDEALLVPLVERALHSRDATLAISRTHAEIEHQAGRLRRLLEDVDDDTAVPEDVVELRRILYGLYAILTLHNAQELEGAFSLVPEEQRR